MHKLYWKEWEDYTWEHIKRADHILHLPGIGLSLSNSDDNLITVVRRYGYGHSASDLKQTIKDDDIVLVPDKNLFKAVKLVNEGKKSFMTWVKAKSRYQFLERDKNGSGVIGWNVAPLLVIPFHNHQIESNLDNWEMFENGGYIYGKRKDGSEVYELKHRLILLKLEPFTEDSIVLYDVYTISDDDDEEDGFFDIVRKLNTLYLAQSKISWHRHLSSHVAELKFSAILRCKIMEEKLTVDRIMT